MLMSSEGDETSSDDKLVGHPEVVNAANGQAGTASAGTTDRPFKCEFPGCGKAFRKGCNLVQHRRVHTGERPYACDVPGCGKRFGQSGNLTKHKLTHRNPHLRWNRHTRDKPFKCEFPGCIKSFTAKSSLQVHQRSHDQYDVVVKAHREQVQQAELLLAKQRMQTQAQVRHARSTAVAAAEMKRLQQFHFQQQKQQQQQQHHHHHHLASTLPMMGMQAPAWGMPPPQPQNVRCPHPGCNFRCMSLDQLKSHMDSFYPGMENMRATLAATQQALDMLRVLASANPDMHIADALNTVNATTLRMSGPQQAWPSAQQAPGSAPFTPATMHQLMGGQLLHDQAPAQPIQPAIHPVVPSDTAPSAGPVADPSLDQSISGYEAELDNSVNNDPAYMPLARPVVRSARPAYSSGLGTLHMPISSLSTMGHDLDASTGSMASATTDAELDSSIESMGTGVGAVQQQGNTPRYGALPLSMFKKSRTEPQEVNARPTAPKPTAVSKESKKRPFADSLLQSSAELDLFGDGTLFETAGHELFSN